jgi:tetratricopeptide (TPR) repeat protein
LWVLILSAGFGSASADNVADCLSNNLEQRIRGCSELIADASLPPQDLSKAYSMRALAYSLEQKFDLAMADYDMAIKLDPNSPIAHNNRAWTLWRLGDTQNGLAGAERSLALEPNSPHALDTRAHILQSMGHHSRALQDYERAMLFGGSRMIMLYQCGLQAAGLFEGKPDGIFTSALSQAMAQCVKRPNCDPLPPEEECRFTTS